LFNPTNLKKQVIESSDKGKMIKFDRIKGVCKTLIFTPSQTLKGNRKLFKIVRVGLKFVNIFGKTEAHYITYLALHAQYI